MTISAMNGGWIQTYTGKRFYPLKPRPEDIDIHDIAHALSMQCRFTGHVREFYSVAQHSILVASKCSEENMKWGLMHDAAEAYMNDLASPVKHLKEMVSYRETEELIQSVIAKKFGLAMPIPAEVKVMDKRALATEARDLMGPLLPGWGPLEEPFQEAIMRWPPWDGETIFLEVWKDLNAK